jgi:Tol biopolymer transport system component
MGSSMNCVRACCAMALAGVFLGTGVAESGGAGTSHGPSARNPGTRLVSVGSGGQQGDRDSFTASISAHGRFVVFLSAAKNLVVGDTNGAVDVFVRDRVRHVTRRVSVAPGGGQANGSSSSPAISADGRYVAFASFATNLVAGDTNAAEDVFVRDRVRHVTRRVSVGPGGSQGGGRSSSPAISAHGRYVAFDSSARNLVPGDTNRARDVFVRDRVAKVTRRVSVGRGGQQADRRSFFAAISAHGRFVAFQSFATDLVAGDTNGSVDVFVRDRVRHVTRRVSVGPGGDQANGESFGAAISAHGRFVAFVSFATDLVAGDTNGSVDVFVRNLLGKVTRRVSVGPGGDQANGDSFGAAISADGRHVAFESSAGNLVPRDTNRIEDVFVRDLVGKVTRRVSLGPSGQQANGLSRRPVISARGRYVAFESLARNLVAQDTNRRSDVFVRDRGGP